MVCGSLHLDELAVYFCNSLHLLLLKKKKASQIYTHLWVEG